MKYGYVLPNITKLMQIQNGGRAGRRNSGSNVISAMLLDIKTNGVSIPTMWYTYSSDVGLKIAAMMAADKFEYNVFELCLQIWRRMIHMK